MRTLLILLLLSLPVSAEETLNYNPVMEGLGGDPVRGQALAAATDRFGESCFNCHMEGGSHFTDHHPFLNGQKDMYLRLQILDFIFLNRQSHIMNRVLVDYDAKKPRYTPQEVADIAAYFSGLPR